ASACLGDGRRQLQPLVRLRTEIVARLRPCTAAQAPASPSLDWSRGLLGRIETLLGDHHVSYPPRATGLFTTWMTELRKRNSPDGCDNDSDAIGNGDREKRSCCCFPAQPNESRLSCGAKLEC